IAADYFVTHQDLEEIVDSNTKNVPLKYLDYTTADDLGRLGNMASDAPLTKEDESLIERAMRDSLKRRWARTMLRLKYDDIVSYESSLPWRSVMTRARQRVNQKLAKDGFKAIREFVDAAGKRHKWYRMHRIVSEIEEAFDVRLERERYQPT